MKINEVRELSTSELKEKLFKVDDVKVSNVSAKSTTRGTRYAGTISGYKKAIVTVADGDAIDLFKE